MNEYEELLTLHSEIRHVVEKLHFSLKRYDAIIDKYVNTGRVKQIKAKLHDLYNFEVAEYMRIRTLPHINEEMWENYKLFGITNLPEQIMLREAAANIIEQLNVICKEEKEHYSAFQDKSGSKRGRKSSKREQVQPEVSGSVASNS